MNEYNERIKKDIINIMFDNRELFSVVQAIYDSCSKLTPDERITYTKLTIDSRMGLNYIIHTKSIAVDTIRWNMDNSLLDGVRKALYKSILFEYTSAYTPADTKKLNTIVDAMSF